MAKARIRIWRFSRARIAAAARYHDVDTFVEKGIFYDQWVFKTSDDASMIAFLDNITPGWRENQIMQAK